MNKIWYIFRCILFWKINKWHLIYFQTRSILKLMLVQKIIHHNFYLQKMILIIKKCMEQKTNLLTSKMLSMNLSSMVDIFLLYIICPLSNWCTSLWIPKGQSKWKSRETGNIGYTTRRKPKQKHNTIYVGRHYMQTSTNNVWALLQTTEGKDEWMLWIPYKGDKIMGVWCHLQSVISQQNTLRNPPTPANSSNWLAITLIYTKYTSPWIGINLKNFNGNR